jgi:hypothetical protein
VNEEEVLVLEKQYIQTMDKILKKKKRLAFANTQYRRPTEPSSVPASPPPSFLSISPRPCLTGEVRAEGLHVATRRLPSGR